MTATTMRSTPTAGTGMVVAIGFVAGLIVGVIGTASAVGWALVSAANSRSSISMPFLIDVRYIDGTLRAESGNGLIVPMLAVAALGALLGLVIRVIRRPK